ncbi:hypothetical protein BKA80DRAFT_280309 [Phyllosticta citrichinensis]
MARGEPSLEAEIFAFEAGAIAQVVMSSRQLRVTRSARKAAKEVRRRAVLVVWLCGPFQQREVGAWTRHIQGRRLGWPGQAKLAASSRKLVGLTTTFTPEWTGPGEAGNGGPSVTSTAEDEAQGTAVERLLTCRGSETTGRSIRQLEVDGLC